MKNRSNLRLLLSTVLVIPLACAHQRHVSPQEALNITFENHSGTFAEVKLVGSTSTSVVMQIPDGESLTVDVAAGEYYTLVCYGHEKYFKSDTFAVKRASAVSGPIRKVLGESDRTHPISKEDFDKIEVSRHVAKAAHHGPLKLPEPVKSIETLRLPKPLEIPQPSKLYEPLELREPLIKWFPVPILKDSVSYLAHLWPAETDTSWYQGLSTIDLRQDLKTAASIENDHLSPGDGSIEGRVTWPDSTPVLNARVRLLKKIGPWSEQSKVIARPDFPITFPRRPLPDLPVTTFVKDTVVNTKGEFRFSNLPAGRYYLFFRAPERQWMYQYRAIRRIGVSYRAYVKGYYHKPDEYELQPGETLKIPDFEVSKEFGQGETEG